MKSVQRGAFSEQLRPKTQDGRKTFEIRRRAVMSVSAEKIAELEKIARRLHYDIVMMIGAGKRLNPAYCLQGQASTVSKI